MNCLSSDRTGLAGDVQSYTSRRRWPTSGKRIAPERVELRRHITLPEDASAGSSHLWLLLAGLCSPAALKRASALPGRAHVPSLTKKCYRTRRAGRCRSCGWTRPIIDTPVGREDAKAVANPAAIEGALAIAWFPASNPWRSLRVWSHLHYIFFSLNHGGKSVLLPQLCDFFFFFFFLLTYIRSIFHKSTYTYIPVSVFLFWRPCSVPSARSFLRRLRSYTDGLHSLPTVLNKSFIFDVWIIEHTTYYSQWR